MSDTQTERDAHAAWCKDVWLQEMAPHRQNDWRAASWPAWEERARRAADRIAELEAQVALLKVDAGRWRWIRARVSAGRSTIGAPPEFRFPHLPRGEHLMRGSVAQHLDAVIDSAISAEKGA